MMNLDQVIQNFCNQPNVLGARVAKACEYRDALARGDISSGEYTDLMNDLKRLDNITMSADELDQQIAFEEVINALLQIPIP